MLNFIIDKYHVGTPLLEVLTDIAARIKPDVDQKRRRAILAMARARHLSNRAEYYDVTRNRRPMLKSFSDFRDLEKIS